MVEDQDVLLEHLGLLAGEFRVFDLRGVRLLIVLRAPGRHGRQGPADGAGGRDGAERLDGGRRPG